MAKLSNENVTEDKINEIRKLLEQNDTKQFFMLFLICAFNPGLAEKIKEFDYDNKMGCLTATDYKQPKQVLHNGIIRKISPLEAERFQTLDDNYTRYGDFNGTIKEISNTKRFECIGNGWTVDVIAHILSFIK